MDHFPPTLPTLASRLPALKSRSSCRGFTIVGNRVVVFESHLELIWMLAAMSEVATIIDQPPPVSYLDHAGVERTHTFDFLVTMRDGRRLFIAVKPAKRARKVRAVANAIAAQLAAGIADEVHVVTDANFTRTERYNASLIAQCARFPVTEDDETIDRITARMTGAVKVGDLVEISGLAGMGFRAIMRLIGRGLLQPVATRQRLTTNSYIVRRPSI